jgi:hypothetical protein
MPQKAASPESDAIVTQLMDDYIKITDWDLSTREANEDYIRRTIRPALGHMQLRRSAGRCPTC